MSTAYADPDPDRAGQTDPTAAVAAGAEVVDLTTARSHSNHPATASDTRPDSVPDAGADSGADTTAPVLVDTPDTGRGGRWDLAAWAAGERRPIVPAWLRSGTELVTQTRRLAGFALHASAYHATRVPKYAARILVRAPRGALRSMRGLARWLFDLQAEPIRQDAARRVDADTYLKLARERDRHVRWRGLVIAASVLPALAAVVAVALLAPGYVRWLAAAAVMVAFGLAGQSADRPLLDTAVVATRVAKLTSQVVVRALAACGLAGITRALAKDSHAIEFTAEICRDGPGWRAEVDLPHGVTAAEVIDRRDKLASGLRRPLGCVWPEGRPEIHTGRLVIWVGDQDMATIKPKPWPLIKAGTVDLFKPFPFGTDPRGRLVVISLMFATMVIGALPRMGKTFSLRLILLAAALDPRAELRIYDLKGTGDLSALEQVAHRYRCGDDDEDIAYLLADARELQAELRRRTKVIRSLPKDLCPENKITPELASRQSLGLHPVVFSMDECQRGFEHATYGKELIGICEDLTRRGPAVGIIPVYATQRPDANSLPTGISANAVLRFCLKVMGQVENDMVLGTSAYKNGIRATMFSRRELGVGYLVGEGDDPRIPRTYYVDNPTADRIGARARAIRAAAGRLSGHALGEAGPEIAERASTLLEDILACCPPEGNGKYWTEAIAARLTEHHPDRYTDLGRDALAAALRERGVDTTVQVWGTTPDGKGANRRGIDTHQIARIVANRNHTSGAANTR